MSILLLFTQLVVGRAGELPSPKTHTASANRSLGHEAALSGIVQLGGKVDPSCTWRDEWQGTEVTFEKTFVSKELLNFTRRLEGPVFVTFRQSKLAEGCMNALSNMPNLYLLRIRDTPITTRELAPLQGCVGLKELGINATTVDDDGVLFLKTAKDLRFLDLSDTRIGDRTLETISSLSKLRVLTVRGTRITDAGMRHLKGNTMLRSLHLCDTGVTDVSLQAIQGLVSLRELLLRHTRITDDGIAHLKDMTKLEVLNIDGTTITDRGLQHVRVLQNLTGLGLNGTKVTADGLMSLRNMPYLSLITAYDTSITKEEAARMRHTYVVVSADRPAQDTPDEDNVKLPKQGKEEQRRQ